MPPLTVKCNYVQIRDLGTGRKRYYGHISGFLTPTRIPERTVIHPHSGLTEIIPAHTANVDRGILRKSHKRATDAIAYAHAVWARLLSLRNAEWLAKQAAALQEAADTHNAEQAEQEPYDDGEYALQDAEDAEYAEMLAAAAAENVLRGPFESANAGGELPMPDDLKSEAAVEDDDDVNA